MKSEDSDELNLEILRLERKLEQAYHVIGVLLSGPDHANDEDLITPEGVRALEYFADPDLYDADFLPFIHPYSGMNRIEFPPEFTPQADND